MVCAGDHYWIDRAGNPGMATGGAGDVLTGIVAARLGLGLEPFVAAVQAVHLHSRAGDLGAAAVGENALIATDIVAMLPAAVAELTETVQKRAGKRAKTVKGEKGGGSRRRSGPAR